MSKTLSLKTSAVPANSAHEAVVLPAPYTAHQLRAMLEALEPSPPHIVADKSVLPPVEDRVAAPIQAPANRHGSFSLNGIAILGSPIAPHINPATGFAHNQVVQAPKGGLISPPPTRNFR